MKNPKVMTPEELIAEVEWLDTAATKDWRTGRKVGRTLYSDDTLIGVLDAVGDAECAAGFRSLAPAIASALKKALRERDAAIEEVRCLREGLRQIATEAGYPTAPWDESCRGIARDARALLAPTTEHPTTPRPYAVVVVIEQAGRLVMPEYPKAPGCFVLPGGKVGRWESPRDAVLREFSEETGILTWAVLDDEPFFVGESHNGKPMWAYRGRIQGAALAIQWRGPEGRVRMIPIEQAEATYHPPFLPAFRRVMAAWLRKRVER